jgi:phage host-nuclease inhibitor protein Gam
MSPAEQQDKNQPQVLRGGAGNVDKIRDILFGSQMRDYESRFARLEETLIKETLEIRETNRRRFDQLEGYIRKEFETVQTRIKSERDERSDSAAQQSRELKDLGESLGRRLRDLDDRGTNVERELRSDMLQQARELTEEIRARHDEIASMVEKRVTELRDGKTDRAALATLFTEVALRLSDQFQIPGSEE